MAQRFSLKDNPIFQKFVPQTPPDAASPVEETQEGQAIVPEGQNLTVKDDRQKVTLALCSPSKLVRHHHQ